MAKRPTKADPLLKSTLSVMQPFRISEDTPLSRRDADKACHMSLSQFATFVGRDRNTIQKYLDRSMPYVQKADRDRGVPWILHSADCVRWLEDEAARSVAAKLNGDTSGITEDEAKRQIAIAKMVVAQQEAAEIVRIVARLDQILPLIKQDYSELRIRLMAVPGTLASKVEERLSVKVREEATKAIKSALTVLRADEKVEKIASGE